MRFAGRADSFGRTLQDDSERSPGRRANEAVRDGAGALRTGDCRVEPPASILVERLSMSHLVPLLEFNHRNLVGAAKRGRALSSRPYAVGKGYSRDQPTEALTGKRKSWSKRQPKHTSRISLA